MQSALAIDPATRSRGLVDDLLRLGLISAEDVVDDRVAVRPAGGRRSRNLRVERSWGGPSCFVKMADPGAPPERLRHEAGICRRLRRSGRPIAAHVPDVLDEPADGVLVLELLESAVGLPQIHSEAGADPEPAAVGHAVGRVLALLHEAPGDGWAGDALPPVFALARPGIALYRSLSGANLACLAAAQDAGTCDLLDELARDWEPSVLTHGDVRLANVMVDRPRSDAPHVWLVDWELAGAGDPAWDLGCLLAHHLSLWLLSISDASHDDSAVLTERAERPLEVIQPGILATWRGYRQAPAGPADPLTAIRHAGASMVEIALSLGQEASLPSDTQLLHLQVAHNILARPGDAAAHLMGLTPSDIPGAFG